MNSQYLVLDGKPWLPVSGEFHYSRCPSSRWETELRKMRAAGVQAVSTYVIWIHHEEVQGQSDFSGDRDIHRFVQLCGELGLSVVLRLGPWVHAEVRNGGLPDWVLAQSRARTDDPAYLSFVTAFWTQLAERVSGQIWKAGGPVIGVQIENEFKGDPAHIATLKSLAVSLGLDVPLYTATAWDRARYPGLQVVPVFGGYQDEPWDVVLTDSAPNETYSFRFFSREGGAYGYPDGVSGGAVPNAQAGLTAYPFLSAEYGCGAASMYRRRVALNLPDDIAATIPVQLGSGVNLYGHYMFHGGRNPLGRLTPLQESTASNSYNDLPIVNYDYQSALGQYGQQRPSLGRIKLFHYFMNRFGSEVATMSSRRPAVIPGGAADLTSLRWSARSNGTSGYVFVNNYVRQYAMADHADVRFQVELAQETVSFPSRGVDIKDGAYFIWPVNLDLADARLVYATAQPITSITRDGREVYVFVAQDGIEPEFAFSTATVSHVRAHRGRSATEQQGRIVVSGLRPGTDAAVQVTTRSGVPVDILVLDQAQADRLWRVEVDGTDVLVLTSQELDVTSHGLSLTAVGTPEFDLATFPAIKASAHGAHTFRRAGRDGLFSRYTGAVRPQPLTITVGAVREPAPAPPVIKGGQAKGALEPSEAVINATQGLWAIDVPWDRIRTMTDAYLTIRYAGDLARIYSGSLLLDDHFYNGLDWSVSLRQLATQADQNLPLTLAIMPLRSDAPIYLQSGQEPGYDASGQACSVISVTGAPVYELQVAAVVH